MFVNFSNHPSVRWSKEQKEAAEKYGEIVDIAFPNVDPKATESEISSLANKFITEISAMRPDAVMCQGEFTLSFAVITRLKNLNIPVYAACSERVVKEIVCEDGTVKKEVEFVFAGFRKF